MTNSIPYHEVSALHADLCSALSDSNRILILYALAEQSRSVGDLAVQVGLSQPAASRHLKILRERNLVRPERQGTTITYSLADRRLIEALDLLMAVLRDSLNYRANLLEPVQSIP